MRHAPLDEGSKVDHSPPALPEASSLRLAEASCSPVRPARAAATFRLHDGPLILVGLVLAAASAPLLIRSGLIPQTLATQLFMTAVAEGVVIGVVVWLARRRHVSLRGLLLGSSHPPTGAPFRWLIDAAWGFALALALLGVMFLLWWLHFPVADPLTVPVAKTSLPVRLVFLVLAAVLAPLSEELLYRGVVQSSLVPRIGPVLACLVQAVLFGLMHQRGWIVILAVSLGGLAYGAVVLWRGSLLPSIITHATMNGLIAGWLVALVWLNAHSPAQSMQEARHPPGWWDSAPSWPIPESETAEGQYRAALHYYGTSGLQLRKQQILAFEQVRRRFPKDKVYGTRALEGVQEVYLNYLDDPRRAMVVGQELLADYPEQRQTAARAMLRMAEANLRLNQLDGAVQWIERTESQYADVLGVPEQLARLREAVRQDRVGPAESPGAKRPEPDALR